MQLVVEFIVVSGDWLGKPANMKVANNGAVVYVGSSLTVHNPLVFVYNLVSKFKLIEVLLREKKRKWAAGQRSSTRKRATKI